MGVFEVNWRTLLRADTKATLFLIIPHPMERDLPPETQRHSPWQSTWTAQHDQRIGHLHDHIDLGDAANIHCTFCKAPYEAHTIDTRVFTTFASMVFQRDPTMSLPKLSTDSPKITGNVYDNLAISSTMFLPPPLPLDAKVSADLALLARSRAILLTATAMYLIDLNGGTACQPPETTQLALVRAKRDIARHTRACRKETSRRAPNTQLFDKTIERLVHIQAESKPSALGSTWTPSLRHLLRLAEGELQLYDKLVSEVRERATEVEVTDWLASSGGQIWRLRHDSAFALLSTWYAPRKEPTKLVGVWQTGLNALRHMSK